MFEKYPTTFTSKGIIDLPEEKKSLFQELSFACSNKNYEEIYPIVNIT